MARRRLSGRGATADDGTRWKGKQSSSTFYLGDGKGPPLEEEAIAADKNVWRLDSDILAEMEGRRGSGRKWNWPVFERAYVEGVVGEDGQHRWPTFREMSFWSGCKMTVIKNRSTRDGWGSKKRMHEQRLPALVEAAAARHVANQIGDYIGAADEAVGRKNAMQWIQELSGEYLPAVMKRLKGDGEDACRSCGRTTRPISHNVQDAEKLLRLLLAAEGQTIERTVIVTTVQVNVNLQRDATVRALTRAAARGFIEEELLHKVLAEIQTEVGRVDWRYKVRLSEAAKLRQAT